MIALGKECFIPTSNTAETKSRWRLSGHAKRLGQRLSFSFVFLRDFSFLDGWLESESEVQMELEEDGVRDHLRLVRVVRLRAEDVEGAGAVDWDCRLLLEEDGLDEVRFGGGN